MHAACNATQDMKCGKVPRSVFVNSTTLYTVAFIFAYILLTSTGTLQGHALQHADNRQHSRGWRDVDSMCNIAVAAAVWLTWKNSEQKSEKPLTSVRRVLASTVGMCLSGIGPVHSMCLFKYQPPHLIGPVLTAACDWPRTNRSIAYWP